MHLFNLCVYGAPTVQGLLNRNTPLREMAKGVMWGDQEERGGGARREGEENRRGRRGEGREEGLWAEREGRESSTFRHLGESWE